MLTNKQHIKIKVKERRKKLTKENFLDNLIYAHKSNFQENFLSPINLLHKLRHLKLEILFANVVVALVLFCTKAAQAERPFRYCFSRIKDLLMYNGPKCISSRKYFRLYSVHNYFAFFAFSGLFLHPLIRGISIKR